jgi:hypothetical protein
MSLIKMKPFSEEGVSWLRFRRGKAVRGDPLLNSSHLWPFEWIKKTDREEVDVYDYWGTKGD